MKYQGGKGRIAKRLMETMTTLAPDATRYVEPFVGGAWVLDQAHASGQFAAIHAGDTMPDLMLMYQAVAEGWEPPDDIPRDLYESLKKAPPSPLRGVAGFGSAYGGNWFTGYCGNVLNGKRTNAQLAAAHLVRRRPLLAQTNLRLQDYATWTELVDAQTVVYCDPPYAGTIGYQSRGRSAEPFDSAAFWAWCARMATERGAHVFVSEYTSPDPAARVVWERTARQTISAGPVNQTVTDRLYLVPPAQASSPA